MQYGLRLKLDCIGEPPHVYVAEHDGRGTCHIKVLERPKFIGNDKNNEDELGDINNWEAGPLSKYLVECMNNYK